MIKIHKAAGLFLVLAIVLLFCISAVEARNITGKTFYTTANIWYERPEKILSTNYHKGTIIPAGTRVTMEMVRDEEISFLDENGLPFKIFYVKKYSSRLMNIWSYFDKYFSEKDPKGSGGKYETFTQLEKDNIEIGEITGGMSKEAVFMSFGLPPGHQTPSLKNNIWIYWVNRVIKNTIYFKDNKVVRIEKGI